MSRFIPLIALILFPSMVLAQALGTEPEVAALSFTGGASYMKGVLHTLTGLDHLIAMIAVGLLSSQIGGRAVWQIPLIFVIALVIGGATGLVLPDSGFRTGLLTRSEEVIVLSDLILPLAIIWVSTRYSDTRAVASIALFVVLFGLFHGFAHGGEIPDGAVALFYVLGFATTSILMHLLGVGIGEAARAFPNPRVARALVAAVLVGISIPYQVDYWNSIMPDIVKVIFKVIG